MLVTWRSIVRAGTRTCASCRGEFAQAVPRHQGTRLFVCRPGPKPPARPVAVAAHRLPMPLAPA